MTEPTHAQAVETVQAVLGGHVISNELAPVPAWDAPPRTSPVRPRNEWLPTCKSCGHYFAHHGEHGPQCQLVRDV